MKNDAPPRTPAAPSAPAPAAGSGFGSPPVALAQGARIQVLLAVLMALFLAALDETIVGTALPRIITDLHGNELYTWVVTIYLLTSTITVPFYGKLSDLFGRKPLLVIGILLFLGGSALCGLAQSMPMLIAFRGIQGIGAGALFPIPFAVVGDLFTPAERGKYQGFFSAVFGVSALIGPAIGGLLTDLVSWHAIFYVNIPIGLASLFVIWRILPTIRRPNATHDLDWLGAGVFICAIAPILVGLTNAQTASWGDLSVAGLIGAGLVFAVIFLFIEAKAKEPIVPLELFRIRSYSVAIIAASLSSFGFFAATIFLPRYFQVVLGRSATVSGYEMFPLLLGTIFSSVSSGQIVARTGRYKWLVVVGTALLSIGCFSLTNLQADTNPCILRGWMALVGLGLGPTFAVLTIVIQNAIPFHQLGVGTSSLTFFRQVAGTVGLAIAATVFASQIHEQIPTQLTQAGVPQAAVSAFASKPISLDELGAGVDLASSIAAQVPAALQPLVPAIVQGIYQAMAVSIGSIFWLALVAAVASFGAALLIHEIPLRAKAHVAPAPVARPASVEAPVETPLEAPVEERAIEASTAVEEEA